MLNMKRIALYIGILYLMTALVGFVFSFIAGFMLAVGASAPWLLSTLGDAALLVMMVLVFARLASIQHDRVIAHGMCVGFGTWLVSYPVNVLILGEVPAHWAAQVVLVPITLSIGVPLGKRWARRVMTVSGGHD